MKKNMKKAVAAVASALLLTGMVVLLINNKKRMVEQSASATEFDRAVNVSTIKVERSFISDGFTTDGVTLAGRELTLSSDMAGRVVEIYVDKGDRVSKDSPLLKLDDELLLADYLAAKAAFEALERDERRMANSNVEGGMSLQQLDNIRTRLSEARSRLTVSRRRYEDAVVKSPIEGTVNFRYAEVGSLVAPNSPLFEIVDGRRMKVVCHVSEDRVGLLAAGQKVTATVPNGSGADFTGRVAYVGIKSDKGLNYPVEVTLDGNSGLMIGVYLRVRFCEGCGHDGILIPRKAVIGSLRSPLAYSVEDGKARGRALKLGNMSGGSIEVLDGLREGEEIIVAGLMNIADGAEVRIINGTGL